MPTSGLPDSGYDWAQRFDEQVKETMAGDPTEVPALDRHSDFEHAVPTPDHFIPLLYLAGLAGASNRDTEVLSSMVTRRTPAPQREPLQPAAAGHRSVCSPPQQ